VEDETAYGGVEEPPRVDRPHIRLTELDVRDSLCGASLLSELERFSVEIYPNDLTLGAN